MSRVVVYGASGITGSLTAQRLAERGISFAIAGRSEKKLAALRDRLAAQGTKVEVRVAEMTDQRALERAFAGSQVVVSAAGPFSVSGKIVLAAAIDVGAHYLDTSGEQAFTRIVYDEYDERARQRGVCAVPGCAFEIVPGDFAAEEAAVRVLAARGPPSRTLDELVVAYCVKNFGLSPGTRLSALEQLGRRGHFWQDGTLLPARPADERRRFEFPEPFGERTGLSFPSSECLSVPRHVSARRVQTYLALSSTEAALVRAGRFFIEPLVRSPIKRIAARLSRARGGPSAKERAESRFCVLAEARLGGKTSRVSIAGRDIYGLTAIILEDAVEQMLLSGFARAGTLAPAEAFDSEAMLTRLAGEAGLVVERMSS